MYSMKRRTTALPYCSRNQRAIGTISPSLTPRCTTILTFTGAKPAASAASMPASTSATGKSASFMRRKMVSSSASRLTVMRLRPASARDFAFFTRVEPFVVRVRSSGAPSGVRSAASWRISTSRCLRKVGSPPVRRSFFTPCAANTPAPGA